MTFTEYSCVCPDVFFDSSSPALDRFRANRKVAREGLKVSLKRLKKLAISALLNLSIELSLDSGLKRRLARADFAYELLYRGDHQLWHFFFAGPLALRCMCRVNPVSVRTSHLSKALKPFLEHWQLRSPNASVIYFFINTTEVDTRLIELALKLLQLTINRRGVALFKAIEKLQLGRR